MTEEECSAWLDGLSDPEDPCSSDDHAAWLRTAELLEERRTLDDIARQNANAPQPIPLPNPEIPGFGSFAEEREKRHDDTDHPQNCQEEST
jgi:hypothetical protein